MGAFLGIFLETALAAIFNLGGLWLGWERLQLDWWMLVPVPLLFGIIMGKAIAGLHLEDY